MNAAVADIDGDEFVARSERRLDGREKSALECELQNWGEWHERHGDYQGYPRADGISAWLDGAGGNSKCHRVLCLEMPNKIYWTQQAVLRLPDPMQLVVWAHYVPCVKPSTGQAWSAEEKARLLGLSWVNYRVRLCRARLRILGLDTDEGIALV